ncbi:hypothetical protein [Haloarcula sp. Atlit-7R]|uniref:hypothetical protein n=1 Tax=Haloarcula sp. Atlit-7R TaxID=2282125 RepID=UPI000EF14495|nr:hypothetical protein [Haloarcula sp. Atlit-7R]RLM94329.1 hypothetical protein D3D01_15825 [Haloarcula sp. Atlit-7R]
MQCRALDASGGELTMARDAPTSCVRDDCEADVDKVTMEDVSVGRMAPHTEPVAHCEDGHSMTF